jgi:RNA polymerase sigma-70 factor (ECF subfamily)
VLDPDVVVRSDHGPLPGASVVVRGAKAVAGQAMMFAAHSRFVRPALVNGAAGAVVDGQPVSVMAFTVRDGTIVAIDALADPERIRRLDLAAFLT